MVEEESGEWKVAIDVGRTGDEPGINRSRTTVQLRSYPEAMFIVCSSFIFGVARLWKPCICSYSAHPTGPWVSARYYVSVVLRYLFICGCPYILGRVVDRVGDSFVESFAVYPPYILMLVEPGLEGEDSVSNFPKSMFLMWHNLAMITRYN
jgi:hypothetical protein